MELNWKYLIVGCVSVIFVCGDDTNVIKLGNNVLEEKNSTNTVEGPDLSTTTAATNQDFKKVSTFILNLFSTSKIFRNTF